MFSNFSQALLELFVSSLGKPSSWSASRAWSARHRHSAGRALRLTDEGGVLPNPPSTAWPAAGQRRAFHAFHHPAGGHHSAHAFLHGSSIGTAAAVVPLTIAAAPFIARLVETSLREVDHGLIEAALAMGATTRQIVSRCCCPKRLPGIVAGLTITFVSLTGYSAMAGAIGGGGLGDLGIRYGYQRFLPEVMLAVVLVLILFVQAVQSLGDWAWCAG
jgi:D-methionine transport system permease protein